MEDKTQRTGAFPCPFADYDFVSRGLRVKIETGTERPKDMDELGWKRGGT
nr:hypothetical protein [[Eubacterium] cellulosolvens]